MKTKTVKQTVSFKATPHEVYEALMDAKKHSKFTGSKAIVSRKIGGKFSIYGGGLSGKNLELVKDKKIVQAWRADMHEWPKNYFSKATFVLRKIKGGTRLTFTQTGVPVASFKGINQGWHDHYWEPMKSMLEK